MAQSITILKTGTKPSALRHIDGDYEEWILRGLGPSRYSVEVIDVAQGMSLPPPDRVAAVVITGSASMVTDRVSWMREGEEWLRTVVAGSVPLLGICFGHQWLAQAFGGAVDYNPKGVEVGTVTIRLTGEARSDPLLCALPDTFPAQATHRQSVLRLPPSATKLAFSELDGCQAFRVGERAWGVQFHPEIEAALMPAYVEHYRRRLLEEGKSPEALLQAVGSSREAAGLLARFARLAELA